MSGCAVRRGRELSYYSNWDRPPPWPSLADWSRHFACITFPPHLPVHVMSFVWEISWFFFIFVCFLVSVRGTCVVLHSHMADSCSCNRVSVAGVTVSRCAIWVTRGRSQPPAAVLLCEPLNSSLFAAHNPRKCTPLKEPSFYFLCQWWTLFSVDGTDEILIFRVL